MWGFSVAVILYSMAEMLRNTAAYKISLLSVRTHINYIYTGERGRKESRRLAQKHYLGFSNLMKMYLLLLQNQIQCSQHTTKLQYQSVYQRKRFCSQNMYE